MTTTFRKLNSGDIPSEFKIVFFNEGYSRALLLIRKATNKTVDFISLREPIKNKSIHPDWYNHNVIFKNNDPFEHPLSELPKLLKEQQENSMTMMEFIIHHNDIMKEKYINSLQHLTFLN